MSAAQPHQSGSFAWRAESFKSPADYSLVLTPQERGELTAAVKARPSGVPAHQLGPQHFAFEQLGPRLRAAYEEVRSGKGFVVLRGLPIDELSLDD